MILIQWSNKNRLPILLDLERGRLRIFCRNGHVRSMVEAAVRWQDDDRSAKMTHVMHFCTAREGTVPLLKLCDYDLIQEQAHFCSHFLQTLMFSARNFSLFESAAL